MNVETDRSFARARLTRPWWIATARWQVVLLDEDGEVR